jgi:putative ABC transport system substrate-binding protein
MTGGKSPRSVRRQYRQPRRREFLFLLAGTTTVPRALRAQQKIIPVIGHISMYSPPDFAGFVAALREGLRETGYVEGQNLLVEHRWAEGRYDRLPALAAELVGRKVDAIVTDGGASPALAAKNATSTIPIVFLIGADPVATGLVASFARPNSNLTGVAMQLSELVPKRLELVSELVPQAKLIALLVNPNNTTSTERMVQETKHAAAAKGLQLQILNAGTGTEIDAVFTSLVQLQADALLVAADPFFDSRRGQIVGLAARHAIPAIYGLRDYVMAGGLISYAPYLAHMYHRVGIYAGKILNGVKPADLPVEQPAKFELMVNLETAKALGLTIPPSILGRADEVIE